MESKKHDWRQDLPEDWTVDWRGEDGVERSIPLREHPALAKYASKDEAVKALAHAQRLLGRRDQAPGGRPEKPEDYAFPELDLDEGFEPDQDVLEAFRSQAYDLGLTAEQAAGLYAWFLPLNMRIAAELRDQTKSGREDELARLRQEHGGQAPRVLEGSLRHQGADGPQALGLEELRSMIRDPRYHDPSRRDPSFVARVDKGFQRLFPGSYAGR